MSSWRTVLHEPGDAAWPSRWFLDGALASVRADDGLVLDSGAVAAGDAGHCVLWTQAAFAGDLRVSYDFTRLDANLGHTSVCILYLQASGLPPQAADIAAWREQRQVASMRLYYEHMQCLHVSYACSGGKDHSYVRARRYPSRGSFDADTRLAPSYEDVDIFRPGETWRLVFTSSAGRLEFSAERAGIRRVFAWDLAGRPALPAGRIGLRQMLGRSSRYRGFTVEQPSETP